MSEKTLSDRLIKVRKNNNLNQVEMAKRLNIGEKTLRSYEKGKDVTVSFVQKVAVEFEVNSYWLMTGRTEPLDKKIGNIVSPSKIGSPMIDAAVSSYIAQEKIIEPSIEEHTYSIAKLSIHASAGDGIENFDIEEIGQVLLDKELFRYAMNPKSLKIIQVKGDSMQPTIMDDCHVVIDENQTDSVDAIYAICLGGQVMIKRLQYDHLQGTIVIRSDNPNYADQIYNAKDSQVPLKIMGKKVLIIQ
jgi:phage repressor protein C with HTH and peptisase S24 domain